MIAALFPTLPEVGLFFSGRVFRGNRTIKSSNDSFEAFGSFGEPGWLVRVGIGLEVNWAQVRRCRRVKAFRAHRSGSSHRNLLPGTFVGGEDRVLNTDLMALPSIL